MLGSDHHIVWREAVCATDGMHYELHCSCGATACCCEQAFSKLSSDDVARLHDFLCVPSSQLRYSLADLYDHDEY